MGPKKILGVYGGLGPAASAEFMRLLAELAPASCDQEHPVVYLYSNPKTPDRSDALLRGGPSPEGPLKAGLETLCRWGADILAVPCNTAHCFIDRFREELPKPLIHIVEATVSRALEVSPACWLVATGATLASGIYEKEGERQGAQFFEPEPDERPEFDRIIRLVKGGRMEEAGGRMKSACGLLWRRRELPVICACTELPLAWAAAGLPDERGVSSLESLARACLNELYE